MIRRTILICIAAAAGTLLAWPVASRAQLPLPRTGTSCLHDATSLPADRADFLFHPLEDDGETESLIVRGRLVRDWIGLTELLVLVRDGDEWRPVLVARPMHVTAGKIAQEDFEQLCEDVASDSAAALLDVYGKTFFGLELEYRRGESAPVAAAVRIRQALDQLATALHEIAAQPAYRLKTRRVREPALAEQGVGDLTLEEACLDPTLAVRYRGGIAFREQVREERSEFG